MPPAYIGAGLSQREPLLCLGNSGHEPSCADQEMVPISLEEPTP